MSTRYESPGHDVDRLQRQLNELFARSGTARTTAEFPPINIWTNADGAVLTAELPGLDLSLVAISVLGDTLTIKGERAEPKAEEGRTFHRVERGFGAFVRTVQCRLWCVRLESVAHSSHTSPFLLLQ